MACCLMTPNHYIIYLKWTNIDLSAVKCYGIHVKSISPEMLKVLITEKYFDF